MLRSRLPSSIGIGGTLRCKPFYTFLTVREMLDANRRAAQTRPPMPTVLNALSYAPISQYNVLFVVTATRLTVRINIASDALTAGSLQIQKPVFGDY